MKRYVTILCDGNKEKIQLSKGMKTYDVIKKLGHHLDNVIVVKEDIPIPLDEELKDGDVVKLIRVASGG